MRMLGQDVCHSQQGEVDGGGAEPCSSDVAAAEFPSAHSSSGGLVLACWWVGGDGMR